MSEKYNKNRSIILVFYKPKMYSYSCKTILQPISVVYQIMQTKYKLLMWSFSNYQIVSQLMHHEHFRKSSFWSCLLFAFVYTQLLCVSVVRLHILFQLSRHVQLYRKSMQGRSHKPYNKPITEKQKFRSSNKPT